MVQEKESYCLGNAVSSCIAFTEFLERKHIIGNLVTTFFLIPSGASTLFYSFVFQTFLIPLLFQWTLVPIPCIALLLLIQLTSPLSGGDLKTGFIGQLGFYLFVIYIYYVLAEDRMFS